MKTPISKPYITQEEENAVAEVLRSGWIMQGEKVEEFERKFCEYKGSKYAVAVSSGTAALHLALLSEEIKEDDEVICPSLSFIATANSIKFVNAKPVFCDVEKHNVIINPGDAEKLITGKTKAILIVHQIGFACDIDGFKKLAEKHNLKLIEDAACAIGSGYKGRKIGGDSSLACFSFHPRKIVTTGEGGMITTNNRETYERIRALRNHGISGDKFIYNGYNYRMTDIQASIGIIQLSRMEKYLENRKMIASMYDDFFEKDSRFITIKNKEFSDTNYQSYCVYIKPESGININGLIEKMNNNGISLRKGITAIHKQDSFSEFNNLKLVNTEDMSENSILLPVYYPLEEKEIKYILENLKTIIN
ncbi:MAG: DegT/DnrJ/EryC1/StrS family aminotransferase [Ignavibacteria bacterium]|nr:DegT/DnrJ/EryC1/StrS family aminotransferase [Ignavibacteria bacterium]